MVALTGLASPRRSRVPGVASLIARRAAAMAKATVERLSGSALTIAGLGCVDVGAFTANTVAGWIVTGASFLLLDWKIE